MSDAYKLSISVQYASNAKKVPTRQQFRRWVKVALERDVQIVLRIVDEIEGRALNQSYRGRDYATNVLTFVYDDAQPRHGGVEPSGAGGAAERLLPQTAGSAITSDLASAVGAPSRMASSSISNVSQPQPHLLYGDVVICAPVVAREAREQGKDLFAHYAHLTLHAALHLQGYNHEKKREAEEMEARETALMLKLRYPAPYLIRDIQ